jgi:hypothetical protein
MASAGLGSERSRQAQDIRLVEAVRAHEILGSSASIAIHHGTFQLGDEGIDTAKRQFLASSPPDSFLILENGQSFDIA